MTATLTGFLHEATVPALTDTVSPALDISIFEQVLEQGSAAQRLTLARQLASFTSDAETPAIERDHIVPVMLKLAVDTDPDVRRALADGVAATGLLHADILFSIIADEDDIALPFLGATPALTYWHMLAVLKVGDPARQSAIALRADLSAESRAFIIKSAPLDVCLALFDNPAVHLSEEEYHSLYTRFGQSQEMAERLLACSDLPLDIRILQAKRASNRMHQLMAERGWVAANDAAELVADAEETAILNILVSAEPKELVRVVEFLVSRNMLTPSIIVRAACLGELHVVECAMANLAGVHVLRARDLMAGRAMGGFKSLHAKSGLPPSCLAVLQAACDVAREEAEEGTTLDAEGFGRRLVEALMTRYESFGFKDRAKHLEVVGRFAEDRVRIIARRLRADIVRAA